MAGATQVGTFKRMAGRFGITLETLRDWISRGEVDAGERARAMTEDAARLAELERQNCALPRSDEVVRHASAFSAAQLDRPSR